MGSKYPPYRNDFVRINSCVPPYCEPATGQPENENPASTKSRVSTRCPRVSSVLPSRERVGIPSLIKPAWLYGFSDCLNRTGSKYHPIKNGVVRIGSCMCRPTITRPTVCRFSPNPRCLTSKKRQPETVFRVQAASGNRNLRQIHFRLPNAVSPFQAA